MQTTQRGLRREALLLTTFVLTVSCSAAQSSTDESALGTGGQIVSTGGFASGGLPSTGGAPGSGGLVATGGLFATGGSPSSGGTFGGGGAPGSGGGSGGTPATGGNPSTGGNASTGGNPSTGGQGATGLDPATLAPYQGALLGAFIGEGTVASTEAQIGRKWAFQLEYFDFPLNFVSFASTNIAAGRIPYITWEPWNVSLDSIASGSQDSTIVARAQGLAALNGKILLRFAHEMNGNWYPWDGSHNGSNDSAGTKYIAAYRHVVDVFRSNGADNVLWVFCPNVDSVPNASWNEWSDYYPGDQYVDWMCFDGYNWNTDTFASMTSRIYPGLAAKNKPILLGETSTLDAEKASFINAIIPAMKSSYPLLKGLTWFHVNKENDWRYSSTSGSLSAFVAMANDPYFNP